MSATIMHSNLKVLESIENICKNRCISNTPSLDPHLLSVMPTGNTRMHWTGTRSCVKRPDRMARGRPKTVACALLALLQCNGCATSYGLWFHVSRSARSRKRQKQFRYKRSTTLTAGDDEDGKKHSNLNPPLVESNPSYIIIDQYSAVNKAAEDPRNSIWLPMNKLLNCAVDLHLPLRVLVTFT